MKQHHTIGRFFIVLFLTLSALSLTSYTFAAAIGSSSTIPDLKLQIPIGSLTVIHPCTGGGTGQSIICSGLTDYLIAIYKWLLGAVGILAVGAIMYAGFLWLTAGGNSGSTKKAQDVIQNAIMGLVLTLGSYLILYTINPDLVKLNPFTINKVAELTMSQKLIPESQDPGSGNGPVGALPTPDKMQMKPPYTTLNVPTSCAGRDARMTPALVSGAMDLQHKYGIPGAIILAQWALESAYGQSPSGQYNYFGIKCTQSSPPCQAGCTQKTTQENTKSGGAVTVQACFKDFASPSAGLEGHARYLTLYNVNNAIPTKTGSWYDYNGNPTSFATFLQKEGYATDPIYASKLQGILTSQCLL